MNDFWYCIKISWWLLIPLAIVGTFYYLGPEKISPGTCYERVGNEKYVKSKIVQIADTLNAGIIVEYKVVDMGDKTVNTLYRNVSDFKSLYENKISCSVYEAMAIEVELNNAVAYIKDITDRLEKVESDVSDLKQESQ